MAPQQTEKLTLAHRGLDDPAPSTEPAETLLALIPGRSLYGGSHELDPTPYTHGPSNVSASYYSVVPLDESMPVGAEPLAVGETPEILEARMKQRFDRNLPSGLTYVVRGSTLRRSPTDSIFPRVATHNCPTHNGYFIMSQPVLVSRDESALRERLPLLNLYDPETGKKIKQPIRSVLVATDSTAQAVTHVKGPGDYSHDYYIKANTSIFGFREVGVTTPALRKRASTTRNNRSTKKYLQGHRDYELPALVINWIHDVHAPFIRTRSSLLRRYPYLTPFRNHLPSLLSSHNPSHFSIHYTPRGRSNSRYMTQPLQPDGDTYDVLPPEANDAIRSTHLAPPDFTTLTNYLNRAPNSGTPRTARLLIDRFLEKADTFLDIYYDHPERLFWFNPLHPDESIHASHVGLHRTPAQRHRDGWRRFAFFLQTGIITSRYVPRTRIPGKPGRNPLTHYIAAPRIPHGTTLQVPSDTPSDTPTDTPSPVSI